jgi:DNA-3-methyladenine glycosylase II
MKAALTDHFATKDPTIAGIVAVSAAYALEKSSHDSAFEVLARSIASQQISGLVAGKIIERLMALHGGRFPTPAELAAATADALRGVGFSFAKIAALQDLARHYLDGRLPDDATLAALDDETIIERCVAVRGIGRWTAQMLLMFHFARHDVMPCDDYGVRLGFKLAYGLKELPKPRALLAYAERWKPYRSAGAWYLWRAIELHREGRLPRRAGRVPRIEMEVPKPVQPAARKVVPGKRKKASAAGKSPTRRAGARKPAARNSRPQTRRARRAQ